MAEPSSVGTDDNLSDLYKELMPVVSVQGQSSQSSGITPQSRERFRQEILYINHTPRTVRVGLANGMVVPIPPTRHSYCDEFVIRVRYHVDSSTRDEMRDCFLEYEADEDDQDFKLLKEEFLRKYQNCAGWFTIEVDYSVSLQTIRDNGGTLFIPECNCYVSTETEIRYHPYSKHDLKRLKLDPNRDTGGIIAEIIDNNRRIGDRYLLLIPGVVTVAKANRSRDYQDGLYIKQHGTYDEKTQGTTSTVQYFPIEEIDKLTFVHKSYLDAKNAPSMERIDLLSQKEADRLAELSARELDQRTKQMQAELAQEKLKLEAENMRLARELETLKLQNERARLLEGGREAEINHAREIERLALKDVYERRSMDRKESESWLKGGTAIALAVAGVVTLAIKAYSWVTKSAGLFTSLLAFL